MKKSIFMIIIAAGLLLLAVLAGCDKEKIVESTEYIETTEYVQLPPDTVTIVDTVFSSDSVDIHSTDTVTVTDTVYQTNYVHDTVTNTEYVYDTITTTEYVYDTVVQTSYAPNEFTAFGALQYYTDPLVFEFINSEFGLSDGYIFYISAFQMETTQLSANEFQNPRIIGNVVPAPELKPWVPKIATRADYGYVNFECTIDGVPMYGRLYSINYEIQGIIWTTVGTFGWLAPKSRWQQDERVMELCLRSFKLNPVWVKKASEASQYRAQRYHQVIQEMQRIDSEINQHQNQTRSDIQEEFYKVMTEQIETFNPESGKMKYLPMYNHAYTDGQGHYFLRDYDDGTLPFDNASQWRKLKIINRNDPNYRPMN